MGEFGEIALGLTMIAAILLLIFGIGQARRRDTRQRGLLMIGCALVFFANVLIWTMPTR